MYNKQPNNKQPKSPPNKQPNNLEIEPDPMPTKASWTPPNIKFKTLKEDERRRNLNVKCIFCGIEYYKQDSKINLNICGECNEKNDHPKQELSPLSTSQLLGISAIESRTDQPAPETIPEAVPEPEPTITAAQVSCKCGSTSYIKHGKRIKKGKDGAVVSIQKYQCLICASFFNSSIKIKQGD